jgi:hypothetical protein
MGIIGYCIVMKEKYKAFLKELVTSVVLSLYPISHLYVVNNDKLLFRQTVLPLIIVSSTAVIIFLFLKSLNLIKIRINNLQLIIPLISIILFLYSFFFDLLYNQHYLIGFIRNRYTLPLALIVIVLLIYYVTSIKNKITFQSILSFLIILNVMPYLNLLFQTSIHRQTPDPQIEVNKVINSNMNSKDPDIYYIILDMYPSGEVLKNYWNFDNSKFLSDLTYVGLKVFPQSKSNYQITYLALNSVLNMQYIHQENEIEQHYLTKEYLIQTLAQNKVSVFLKNRGYNYYIFEGGIIPEVSKRGVQDFYLASETRSSMINHQTTPDNDFFLLFIKSSIISPFADRIQSVSSNIYRKRINYVLDKLPKLSKQLDKKFVIAHIMCPHSPYIFGENAEDVFVDEKSPNRKKAFIQQLKFINKKVIPVINQIVKNDNGRDKIILLQGDHGTREIKPNKNFNLEEDWVKEYFGNLNAIYMSNKLKHDSITYLAPVNTFRQIFNLQFNENFEILADKKYYTDFTFPLIFHKLNILKNSN